MYRITTSMNRELASHASLADNYGRRLKGLMLRSELPPGHGLIIQPCNMIHTHFMRFPIDVLFVSKEKEILHIITNMRPWRQSPRIKGAYYVVELPAGTVGDSGTETGHFLSWQ